MKICLYCAKYDFEELDIPLGIGSLAAYLIQEKIVCEKDIRIVNSLKEAIEFKPDILGVSSVSLVIGHAREFAKKCKEAVGCLTILGSYHITAVPNKLPEEFDLGVLGEGELTLAEIINFFKKNKLMENLDKIKGICYKKERKIIINERRDLIKNLDTLPLPYRIKGHNEEIPIFTSRGCPYRCIFCASTNFWKNYRLRSADSVVFEIKYLVDKNFPKKITINILDDLWIANKERFKEIVKKLVELKVPEKTSFVGFCRSNLIYEEDIKLLKKMNYKHLRFGAETGSEVLLKKIKGNNISVKDHQRVIDLCQKHNLPCRASFMLGIPGETKEDVRATINFLRKNKGKLTIQGFYFFKPLPGTEIWEDMKRKKLISENFAFEDTPQDFTRENFSWKNVSYFNEENVPLKELKIAVDLIKKEFIYDTLKRKVAFVLKEYIIPNKVMSIKRKIVKWIQ